MNNRLVELAFTDRVATLTLNRPQSYNALNQEMLKEMVEALEEVKKSSADFLVLKGSGKAFSAGGDIKMMTMPETGELFPQILETIGAMVLTLYTMPQLTIAAIHGSAAGLGLSLALACDYVIAEEQAKVAMNFIGIGLIPDGGGHYFLKERLGAHQAKHLIWKGEVLSGAEAQRIGVVDEATADLEQALQQKLSEWARKPVLAMKETKQLYMQQTAAELQHILKMETKGQAKMRDTKDHREGIQAFLEKRLPTFAGR
ncbi:enoyl-CoA hydratase [Bacillus songklensis]|uniref:Enoyl-CoA hydratase n=1 Tax=Bacillus songklensis TaxID=1069116 RepID=A0ABV8B1M1_9BACI